MKAKQTTPMPRAPRAGTLRDPRYTILDASGTRLVCWCPVNRCGAIYVPAAGVWNIHVPISFAEFLAALKANRIVVDSSPDLLTWIDACTAAELPRPTAPGGTC